MPKKLIILKLGGSLLTDKSKPYTLRTGILERISEQIAKFRQKNPKQALIIINGNGSFGHTTAKKYDLHNGFGDFDGQIGFCLLQKDTALLNRLVVDSLLRQNLPAISFSPNTVFWSDSEAKNLDSNLDFTSNSNLHSNSGSQKNQVQNYQSVSLEVLELYLEKGFIPTFYGEVILDKTQNSTTISSDKIPEILIKFLQKNQLFSSFEVINAGSYDGVLDNKQKVIPTISWQNYEEVKKYLFKSQNPDVSGGMQQKIQEFLELSKLGVKSTLINGLLQDNIYKSLNGEKVDGTEIF